MSQTREEVSSEHNGATDILRLSIKERKEEVEKDPDLIVSDMATQSRIIYETRPRWQAAGIDMFKVGKKFRQNMTNKIEDLCEELGVTREEIGIFAQARTFLYFGGQKYNVGYKNVEELMNYGTDLILIEKEGMAEVLRPFAEKYGIAVLNSIGFVARYAEKLAKLSEETGSHIVMLTDFDVSGLTMTRKLPFIYRIGIDFSTVEYFGLTNKEVEEDYDTSKPVNRRDKTGYNHWKGLLNMVPAPDEDPEEFKKKMEYLRTKRIEIDSVVARLKKKHGKVANRKFWEYIVKKLVEKFPIRDYNRSIYVPDYVDPYTLMDFVAVLRKKITDVLEDYGQGEVNELAETKGVIKDVERREQEIKASFQDIIMQDKDLGPILEKFQELTQQVKRLI